MRLTLRDYQVDALDRIDAAEARGIRKQLGVAATGLGKTIVFSALAERRGCRTLILAHRDELIEQAVAKVREVWPEVDVGVVKAERNEIGHRVVVASVQTLSRRDRLAALDPDLSPGGFFADREPFGLVVVDEAHHATAESYGRILAALRAGESAPPCEMCSGGGYVDDDETGDSTMCWVCNGSLVDPFVRPGPLLLGVTATPDRGDGKGLVDVFDEITFSYDILWGIRSGYLCDLRGLAVTIEQLNLADVKVSRGDYEVGDAGRALSGAGAPLAIARSYVEHALGRRALVFTPTVATAVETADAFGSLGVRAGFVSGETPLDDRRRLLGDFESGALDVMVNCMVLTEGYDNPRVDCVIVARPTKSRALYTQMIGRGTRRHPDKLDCLVLDVVGVAAEHSLVTIPSLFGVEAREMAERLGDGSGSLSDVLDEIEREAIRLGLLRAEEVELFGRVRQRSVAWVQVHVDGDRERRYVIQLGKNAPTVVLVHRQPDRDDGWLAGFEEPDGSKHVLIRDATMEWAQGVGEDFARKNGEMYLVDANAKWRAGRPSKAQRDLARKLHLTIAPDEDRGLLSDRITAELTRRKAERAAAKRAKERLDS